MIPQSLNHDFEEGHHTQAAKARPEHHPFGYVSPPQIVKIKSPIFKLPKNNKSMTTNEPIHDYDQRLVRARHSLKLLPNGEVTIRFLDHLGALGLSIARVTKYAAHLPVLLRMIDTDLKSMSKADVETIVAAINCSKQKALTKRDKKLTLRKLIQYAKVGSCAKGTPMPPEINWISLAVKDKDSRVTPENLLTQEDFTAIIKATTNKRDRAMVYVLFEAALPLVCS
jgi:hypothetical protein